MWTPPTNKGMVPDTAGADTEDELDDMLKEAEHEALPLKNRLGETIENIVGSVPRIPHAKKTGIVLASLLFLVLVYLAYIFIAPSFQADAVRSAPLQNPETEVERAAAEKATGFLNQVQTIQQQAENDSQTREQIRQLGSFEFLLVVTSQRNDQQIKIWSAFITVENGLVTRLQRNVTEQDAECIGWMTADKAAQIELTAPQLAQQIVQGNVKIAPRRCSTDIARKAADIVLNQ